MRKRLLIFGLLATLVFPVMAVAGPLAGTYKTLDGDLFPGKATESAPADGAEGQLGNMIWAESFDDVSLGAQWKLMCPAIASDPVLLSDDVDENGNGMRSYRTEYGGGTLWLTGAAAWGGGEADYTATLTSFTTTVYKQYVNFEKVGAVTNISCTGVFEDYDDCFEMVIANAELIGLTPYGYPEEQGPFPPFHGPSDCDVIGAHGTYWNTHDITLSILGECIVQTDETTWGQVKSIYR
jgi:hypothetical protein